MAIIPEIKVKVSGPWWAVLATGSARRFIIVVGAMVAPFLNAAFRLGVSDSVVLAILGLAGGYAGLSNWKQVRTS